MLKDNIPLVLVEWDDASTDNEPVTIESVGTVHKPTVIHTLGWLLQQDTTGVTLVNEYYGECFRGRTFVPAGMIRSVTPFKLTKAKVAKVKSKTLPATPASEPQTT